MKKCPECSKEVDKYGVACQYCGHIEQSREKKKGPVRNLLEQVRKILKG